MKSAVRSAILVLTILFGLAAPANSDWHEHTKLLASDGDAEDRFGQSISIDGDHCVIGASYDDDFGDYSGSAYVLRREGNGWVEQVKLVPPDGAEQDYFGCSVSISGEYIVVGAKQDDDEADNSGSAYLFRRTGQNWIQESNLTASDAAIGDKFGHAVSIDGDYAVIGAVDGDGNEPDSGSAYIFKRDGEQWVEQAKLVASDGSSNDTFGWSVSISGDHCVIGAFLDDHTDGGRGSAYVYKREEESWVQQAKLVASHADSIYGFGESVSISRNYCLIGTRSNAAYVFERNGENWMEQSKLGSSDLAHGDRFGISVSISGSRCLVGASGNDDFGESSGAAYIFECEGTNWIEQAKLLPSDGEYMDYFGIPVAIDGNCCLIGATGDDDSGNLSGSAYIFVTGGVPVGLEISGPEELLAYSSGQFTAALRNDNGSWDDMTSEASWSVEPESHASIDANGLLTVNGTLGDIVIRAQYGDFEAETIASVYTIEGAVFVPGQYETIQAAIDAVSDGNVVIVTPGTYGGEGNYNIDFRGKAITVRSLDGPESCIIDCWHWSGRRGFIFSGGEGPDSILSGFTITKGHLYGSTVKGAGIYCSGASPTIENCIITDNWAYGQTDQIARGGGIYIESNGAPTIIDCVISDNEVAGGDGQSAPLDYSHSGGPGYGGGICCDINSSATIINCLVVNNEVVGGDGGSSMVWGSSGGDAYGGGMYVGSNCHVIVQNCTITGNTVTPGLKGDSGMASPGWDGTAYGAGVCCREGGTSSIENCVIWGDSGTDELYGGATVIYSDVEGSYPGEGNINADPLFVAGPSGDYYLSQISAGQAADSPCLDTGNETAANLAMCLLTTRSDEVGDDGIVDLGYHYWMPNPTDFNRDGKVDLHDLAVMGLQWQKEPSVPPADCAPGEGDGIVDGLDLRMLSQNWLWCK